MSDTRLWLATMHRYFGTSGISGVVLLIAAVGFWLVTFPPLQRQIAALSAQESDSAVSAPRTSAPQSAIAKNPLSDFYRRFPPAQGYAPRLERFYRAAQAEGLILAEGTYRAITDNQGKLTRYEISLPTKGNYVQIRRFLRRIFTEFPTVALDRLTLQRGNISDGQVEAQIQFVWYLTGEQ